MPLTQGLFPEKWKYSIIKPIYKNGDKCQISSYRPVSWLTGFLKIMKIIITWWSTQHLEQYNILTREQHGLRNGVSTSSAIYKLTNSLYEAWNNKLYIVAYSVT
jgi:hypothetical protein